MALLVDCLGNMFLQMPKSGMNNMAVMSERATTILKEPTQTLKSADFEDFDFPLANSSSAARGFEKKTSNYFAPRDAIIFDQSYEALKDLMLRDSFAPSFQNAITVSCLETLVKWQLAEILPVNFALYLHYSRYGHYQGIRKIAIEALLVVDGFRNEAVVRYIALLIIHDPDHSIRYFTIHALSNFCLLCQQKLATGYYPEMQKQTLNFQISVLQEIWTEDEIELCTPVIAKYARQILRTCIEKPKLKLKLGSTMTALNESLLLVKSQQSLMSMHVLILDPFTTPRPLKKANRPSSSLISPPKPKRPKLQPQMEHCKREMRKLMNQQNSFWFHAPVLSNFNLG